MTRNSELREIQSGYRPGKESVDAKTVIVNIYKAAKGSEVNDRSQIKQLRKANMTDYRKNKLERTTMVAILPDSVKLRNFCTSGITSTPAKTDFMVATH